jgi:hypothetical protein
MDQAETTWHRTTRLTRHVVLFCLAFAACSTGTPAPPGDAAVAAGPDAGVPDAALGDSAMQPQLGDLGPLSVSCALGSPYLVVTKPPMGDSTTLVRVPLHFSHAATGVSITSVTQLSEASGATLRTWDGSQLQGPPGWNGTATPDVGATDATVLWTVSTTALAAETAACAQPPWARTGGTFHVVGSTNEGGGFAVDCSYDLHYHGASGEPIPFACASGVAGWLGDTSGMDIQTVTNPIVALLVETGVHVHNLAAAVDGFTATGLTIYAHAPGGGMPGCPSEDPAPAALSGGMETLWRGTSGTQIWSGPVAPGEELLDVGLEYQQIGATSPPGFCVKASTMMTCPPMVLELTITGTSSAGAYRWESSLFTCILP